MGVRNLRRSCPEETRGKISRPRYGPRRAITKREARTYAEIVSQRFAVRRSRMRPSLFRTRCSSEGASSASGACSRRIHVDNTGTRVLDNKYEAAIAKPTASESGTKSECETPVMKKEGTNTARMHSIASSL